MTFPATLLNQAEALLAAYRRAGLTVATAESCTGGLVAGCLTEIAGSSDVFECGLVSYSNAAKTELLGVPAELIDAHGAVSAEVAEAMARGALAGSKADATVALTGVAGPGGGTVERPVGLVHLCAVRRGGAARPRREIFAGDRAAVRLSSVAVALEMLDELI
ncbi:MAG: nicotinamide-nucleotide amidohydrolase family protein [Kiloniellales bacterium]